MEMMLEQFKTIFDRPEKVKKLREMILDLAVKGKLVEQDPNDEPASVLLERIKEEKERLIKEKKIKKEKALAEISEEEKPFELPEGWEWARLGNIGDWGAGATPPRTNLEFYGGNINWLKTGELNDSIINNSEEKITELALEKCSLRLNKPGDILIAMYGATIGKLGILNCEATTNQACCACTPYSGIYNKYLFNLLLSMRGEFRSKGSGGAQPNISRQKIINTIVSIPPLQEQKRIVEKVDFLMSFCDKLEEALEKKVHYGELCAKSIFNSIGNVSTSEELEEALKFILANFKDISLGDNAVKELKNCILQLAVQGKLVEQDPNDEPASVLLEKIKEEKEKLIKEKKIKKEKHLPDIGEEEKPFKLPEGWEWSRLNDISYLINGDRSSKYPKKNDLLSDGIPFFGAIELHDSLLNYDSTLRFISKEKFDSLGGGKLKNNDIVVLLRGSVGRAGIFFNNTKYNTGFINAQMVIVRLFFGFMNKYIIRCMESNVYKNQIHTTGSAIEQLPACKLKGIIVPIPPLQEQKRIVEKVDSLMALCDELENKIQEQKKYSNMLMESILKNSFSN